MDLIKQTLHNDGPEHYCGLCRVGLPHTAPENGGRREHLEKLIVRCMVSGIIQPQGVDYLFGLI